MTPPPATILAQFFPNPQPVKITPLGNGLINDTFLLHFPDRRWVLQRINPQVFPHPEKIIHNLGKLQTHPGNQKTPLKIPALLPTRNDGYLAYDQQQTPWRVMEFIENSESRETITSLTEAAHVGVALAQFHRQFHSLDVKELEDSLLVFHDTPLYLAHYDRVCARQKPKSVNQEQAFCLEFIDQYRDKALRLEQARQQGVLCHRVTHGDPKLNNFLFERNSDRIIALIDLDTVKPNLIHYDIADCVRSCCQTASHRFDLKLAKALLHPYLQQAKSLLSPSDIDYLYPAIELLPFELGLRFFTDHLQGNHYFKVDYPDHNLDRACHQFSLCQHIQQHQDTLKAVIDAAV